MICVILNIFVYLLRNILEYIFNIYMRKLSFFVMIDVLKCDIGVKIFGYFGERECVGYCFI